MAKLSKDLSIGNLHPRETIFASGNLGAINAEIIIPADGATSVMLDLRGTFNLTAQLLGTVDSVNWTPIPVKAMTQGGKRYLLSIAGSTLGVWAGKISGYKSVKVIAIAYTSGTAQTVVMASNGMVEDAIDGQVSVDSGTITGAASAAVTLTLASPGVGLRHYINKVRVTRFAAAALTAAAAPIVLTTTNLPTAIAFSIPAEAAAQGTVYELLEDFGGKPLVATAQNTATTIVAGVVANVIWRISAYFYVAP